MIRHAYAVRVVHAVAAAACLTTISLARQADSRPWVFLSASADEPADREPAGAIKSVLLRPNVEEPLYLYVRNPTDVQQELTVVIAAGPEDAEEFARAAVRVGPRQTARVLPPRPERAPAAPPLPAGTKPPAPPMTPLGTALHLRLLDKAEVVSRVALPVRVQLPSQYVAASATFQSPTSDAAGRLVVRVSDRTPRRPFTGPPAKLRLDVSPVLVPDLIADSVRDGAYRSELQPGGSATLAAANLRFRGSARKGVVAVSVDGYDRAFLFETDFAGTAPQPVTSTLLRIAGPHYAVPGRPCPVRLEVDNPPRPDLVTEFGIDRANTGDYAVQPYAGDRFRAVAARWDAAARGLVFVTEVRDHVADLDTAGMLGTRRLRLRLTDKDGNELAPPVYDDIVLDDTPPESLRLGPPPKAVRGKEVELTAYGEDPESGVNRVLFFLGEPPAADGKPAVGGRVAVGSPPARVGGAYAAPLLLPDRVGRIAVGARFVNNVGLARDFVDEIEVVDPPPKPTTGAIKVKVVQGTAERPQRVQVQLRDEKNAVVLKNGDTDEKGEYTFKDLAPGKYIVYSAVAQDRTKAQKPVTVEAGKTEPVTLALKR